MRPKFTKRGGWVDDEIKKQLDIVCDTITGSMHDVKSIVLTGGFARGEGPVKVSGRKIYPYNDYDITVVCENPAKKHDIDSIASKASGKLGYHGTKLFYPFKKKQQKISENFYVDLKVVTTSEMKKADKRIRNYEFRKDGMVLFGDDLRSLIPGFSLSDVPLSDAAKLILDRMSQMAEYFSVRGGHDPEMVTYIIQQSYAACCTALLMMSGKYETGYERAANIFAETYRKDFPQLYSKIPDLHTKIKKYVAWKLMPDSLPDMDIRKAWFRARDDIFEVAKFFFSEFTDKKIEDAYGLSDAVLQMGWKFHRPFIINRAGPFSRPIHPVVVLLLKYKYFNRVKASAGAFPRIFMSRRSPDELIFSAVPLILMCVDSSFNIDAAMHDKALELLSRVYPPRKIKNWDGTTEYFADAYIAFFLQKV